MVTTAGSVVVVRRVRVLPTVTTGVVWKRSAHVSKEMETRRDSREARERGRGDRKTPASGCNVGARGPRKEGWRFDGGGGDDGDGGLTTSKRVDSVEELGGAAHDRVASRVDVAARGRQESRRGDRQRSRAALAGQQREIRRARTRVVRVTFCLTTTAGVNVATLVVNEVEVTVRVTAVTVVTAETVRV